MAQRMEGLYCVKGVKVGNMIFYNTRKDILARRPPPREPPAGCLGSYQL